MSSRNQPTRQSRSSSQRRQKRQRLTALVSRRWAGAQISWLMTNPVPGYAQSTPYGKRGSYWSCDRDAYGNGIHTGVDYSAPAGSQVVAARGGKVVYCSHGTAFGYHQLEILPGDGTRDFYAHMTTRTVENGAQVATGQMVGKVGAEGNVTGPHLHFERHAAATGGWSCAVVRDPAPSINHQSSASSSSKPEEVETDPMPQFVNVTDGNGWQVNTNDWAAISWPQVSSDGGEVASKGNPGLDMGGARYSATLCVQIAGLTVASVWTRPLEGHIDSHGDWIVDKYYAIASHVVPGKGDLYLTDARQGNCGKDRKLRWQINASDGAQVKQASLLINYWK